MIYQMKFFPVTGPRHAYHYTGCNPKFDEISHDPTKSVLFSIVMPVYNGKIKWLIKAINSIRHQWYHNWELVIVNDGSSDENLCTFLSTIKHPRIIIVNLGKNCGVSIATNEGLACCNGEYITFIDQDDELTPDALIEMKNAIVRHHPDLIYTDEDKFSESLLGRKYIAGHFKPDYSPDLLLSQNYITHLFVVQRDLLSRVGVFRSEFDGAHDYDLALRASEAAEKICHIRKVLYHWRYHPGSMSHKAESRTRCSNAGLRAVAEAMKRRGVYAKIDHTALNNHYHIQRGIIGEPLVSILIPFCDRSDLLERCFSSIISKTTYRNYEIVGISNNSTDKNTREFMARWEDKERKIRFDEYDIPFNYSKINNHAVGLSQGEYVVLMNNDIEIMTPQWIEMLLAHAQRPEIGAAGGKLYYPDGTIQHAGIVIGIRGFAGRPYRRFPKDSKGYLNRIMLTQDVSAVSGALMMMMKCKYVSVGGMDESHLPVSLNDVDLCLRLLERGLFNVYTPYCEAMHDESSTRGSDESPDNRGRFQDELEYFRCRHQKILSSGDPFYNPNLSLENEDVLYVPEPYLTSENLVGCYCREHGIFCGDQLPETDRS